MMTLSDQVKAYELGSRGEPTTRDSTTQSRVVALLERIPILFRTRDLRGFSRSNLRTNLEGLSPKPKWNLLQMEQHP